MKRDPAWRLAACPMCAALCRVHLTKQPVKVGKRVRLRWLPEYLDGLRHIHSCGKLVLEKGKFITIESFQKNGDGKNGTGKDLEAGAFDFVSDADPEDDFQVIRARLVRNRFSNYEAEA